MLGFHRHLQNEYLLLLGAAFWICLGSRTRWKVRRKKLLMTPSWDVTFRKNVSYHENTPSLTTFIIWNYHIKFNPRTETITELIDNIVAIFLFCLFYLHSELKHCMCHFYYTCMLYCLISASLNLHTTQVCDICRVFNELHVSLN